MHGSGVVEVLLHPTHGPFLGTCWGKIDSLGKMGSFHRLSMLLGCSFLVLLLDASVVQAESWWVQIPKLHGLAERGKVNESILGQE